MRQICRLHLQLPTVSHGFFGASQQVASAIKIPAQAVCDVRRCSRTNCSHLSGHCNLLCLHLRAIAKHHHGIAAVHQQHENFGGPREPGKKCRAAGGRKVGALDADASLPAPVARQHTHNAAEGTPRAWIMRRQTEALSSSNMRQSCFMLKTIPLNLFCHSLSELKTRHFRHIPAVALRTLQAAFARSAHGSDSLSKIDFLVGSCFASMSAS